MGMRSWGIRSIALAAVSTLCVVAPVVAGVSTAAGSAPPWEPDPGAAPPYGNVLLYDANGNQITSGTNLDSPFAYAVALTAADSGATKAIVNFYNPQHGVVPGNWSGTSETGVTTFSPASSLPAGTPADVAADAPDLPVAATSSADITTWLASNVPDTTAGYANTIQVRLTDSGPFGAGNASGTYWETDIGYNATGSAITVDGTTVPAHGWAQLFPLVNPTTTALGLTPSASPQPAGTVVKLTATLSAAHAGTVHFFDGTTALGTPVTVSGTTASFSYTPGVGSHSYTATFVPNLGDETGADTATATIVGGSTSSAASMQINASAQSTTTTVSSSPNPSVSGQSVTYTATVSPTPSGGTVAFSSGSSQIGTCKAQAVSTTTGEATCVVNPGPNAAGLPYSIIAVYSGNSSFQGSTATAISQTVNRADSTTALTSWANPAGINAPVTLTAAVTPTAPGTGSPGGSVEFQNNSTDISGCGSTTVTNGVATCSTSFSSSGTDSLTAIYVGDTNFTGSTSSAVSEKVLPTTTTTVTSSANPSVFGQQVTYTATVAPQSGSGTPTGSVTFKDGAQAICSTVTLSSATATCSSSTASIGPHTITVVYAGDSNFGGSTSSALTQTVDKAATTTSTVTSSATPAITGQVVTLSANVAVTSPGQATPTGTVAFDDPTPIPGCAAQAVSAGKATCQARLAAGASPYSITAAYSGNADLSGSSSSTALAQTVNPASTSVVLTSSANPSLAGQAVTYTASIGVTLPGSGTPAPTGTVEFSDPGTPIPGCTARPVSGGRATCTVTTYSAAGTHSITAAYSGDSNFIGSTSAVLSQKVAAAAGYWEIASNGGVFTFGNSAFEGSLGNVHLAAPIVGIAHTPDRDGYWLVAADGGVFGFGDAHFYGSLGSVHLAAPIVGIVSTPSGHGYWLVGADGGVFGFGDAGFHGSLGDVHLAAPIVGITSTPSGEGYTLVGRDGGVFTFGDAGFHGSLGDVHLAAPIVGVASTPSGSGYWLVGRDGGVFTFGDAGFHGSLGGIHLAAAVVQIVTTPDGGGYWLIGDDGGTFTFGDAVFHGSLPGLGVSTHDVIGAA